MMMILILYVDNEGLLMDVLRAEHDEQNVQAGSFDFGGNLQGAKEFF